MADSTAKPPVDIGEVVEGRYKILKPLAEGGMGSVFLAEHWLIKRRVAMKILHREFAEDAEMIRRFMNEALAAGTLGHPNIVESTDMGFTKNDVPYIVYEYIEGTLLSDEIYRVPEFPVRRALRVAFQIASALEAAHNAGIVHRDLKSDNVFLTDRYDANDHVKVLDFGISRFLTASQRTARKGMLMGTPEYMAPEQVLAPDSVDKRADIYALGVVLYEMLAGRLPFMFGTTPAPARASRTPNLEATHALLHRIVGEMPPPLGRKDAPPGLSEMLHEKLLAKEPAKRYQSMKDVQNAIEAFASVTRSRSGSIPIANLPASAPQKDHSKPPSRRPSEIDAITDQTLSRSLLEPGQLEREVKQLGKRWTLDGNDLKLELISRSMSKLVGIVAQVGTIADEMDHHPKVAIDYPYLRLWIRAYDANAITVLDLVFAARLEQWLRDNSW
jgi:serine/threonine protein kinase